MAQGNPLPGEKYLHFKNKMYQVVTVAYHSETMERYVVYQALYGDFRTYVRPFETFVSEVDHEKYPLVKQKYRFRYLEDGRIPEMGTEKLPKGTDNSACGDRGPREELPEGTDSPVGGSGEPRDEASAGTDSPACGNEEFRKEADNSACGDREPREELPEGVNPWLIRFLDAESYEEKYKIVCDLCRDVDDKLIDDIAVVMDVAIPEGRLEERYNQLKTSIRIRLHYEQTRLR